jgi:hypothetical protein
MEGTIVRSVLKEAPPATGTLTPEQQTIRRINEEMAKGNSHEAIEAAKKQKLINKEKIDKKAEEIGVGEVRDALGKKDRSGNPAEEKRFKEFNKSAELNKEFLEKGYDKITDTTKQDKLRTSVQNAIISDPALSSEFLSLSVTDQKARLELILKDPRYASSLRETMSGILEQKIIIEDKEIQEKVDVVTEKENKREEANRVVKEIAREKKAVDASLKEFERDPSGVARGTRSIRLDSLRPVATLQRDTANLRKELQIIDAELNGLRSELSGTSRGLIKAPRKIVDINLDITNRTKDKTTAESNLETNEGELQEISKLQAEEAALKEKSVELEKSKSLKNVDLKAAEYELSKANRQLDDLKRVRADSEDDLVSGMKNAGSEAANKYFLKEMDVAEAAFNKTSEEEKKKTTNVNERAMLDALQERWLGSTKGKGTKKYRPIDRAKVESDFYDLTISGPEPLMKKLLQSRVDPASHARIYTDVQIDAMLAEKADGGFYTKMEPKVAAQLIRRKILSGGMRKEDVSAIESTPWGQQAVSLALQENAASRENMEKLIGEKAVNPGFMAKLWSEMKKKPWLFAVPFGIVALPIIAARSTAASQMVK